MLQIRQIHSLHHLPTAHLAQTMTLLELNATELRQKIEKELASNPALELLEDRRCPNCQRRLPVRGVCPVCSSPAEASAEQPIVFISSRQEFYQRSSSGYWDDEDSAHREELTPAIEELPAFVLRQIAPELALEDRVLAAHILSSLDEDGLITIPLSEVAIYHHVSLSRVQGVLNLIQKAEPLGVGSSSPAEALSIQVQALSETCKIPPKTELVIQRGLDLLSQRRYAELGRKLHLKIHEVQEIAHFISENLNPFPGRAHWGEISSRNQNPHIAAGTYYFPDVIISRLKEGEDTPLMVEIAQPIFGSLRINPLFRAALQEAPPEKTEEWKSDLEQATLLVKCLQQRNHTLVRMMERLTVLQRQFILHGDQYLQPITRASLAESLELHESTISRAVADKAIQLPNRRIVPLALFFDRSLHIRTLLKQIIEQETRPYSDAAIVQILKNEGISIARRTVAKYRAMEGILPAYLRASSKDKKQDDLPKPAKDPMSENEPSLLPLPLQMVSQA